MRRLPAMTVTLALGLSACQTVAGSRSATVNLDDPATHAAVEAALARAVGRARVELGPPRSGTTSTVTVLPPPPGPHETHAMALPVTFDIVSEDGPEDDRHCVAIRRDTKDAYDMPGVECDVGN